MALSDAKGRSAGMFAIPPAALPRVAEPFLLDIKYVARGEWGSVILGRGTLPFYSRLRILPHISWGRGCTTRIMASLDVANIADMIPCGYRVSSSKNSRP